MDDTPSGRLVGLQILVVEDEFFIADDLKRALLEHGADVVGPVSTVDRARSIAGQQTFDLAVLDVNLMGEMIFPFAAELRARGIPFIFTTGYEEAMVPPEYRDVERWQKPFTARRLAQALARLQ